MKKAIFKYGAIILLLAVMSALLTLPASAAMDSPLNPGGLGSDDPNIQLNLNGEGSDAVRIVMLMTILTLLPSILVMMTSFTRIIIVFSLFRNAIGLQQTPPNQVLIGLALFLTMFIMHPVITAINETAYKPLSEGTIDTQEFMDRATVPLKDFMMKQTRPEELNLYLDLAGKELPETIEEYTMDIVIPAFMTSEIRRAFIMGFYMFIPFLVIDMVVASALMSMGMMMLPPVTISMPFKIMLFVMVDGWTLLIRTLVSTYHM